MDFFNKSFKAIFKTYELIITRDFQFYDGDTRLTIEDVIRPGSKYKIGFINILAQLDPKTLGSFQKSSKLLNDFIEENRVWELAFKLKFKSIYEYVVKHEVDVRSYLDRFSVNPRRKNLWKRYYEFYTIKITLDMLEGLNCKIVDNDDIVNALRTFRIPQPVGIYTSIFKVNPMYETIVKKYSSSIETRPIILTVENGFYMTEEIFKIHYQNSKIDNDIIKLFNVVRPCIFFNTDLAVKYVNDMTNIKYFEKIQNSKEGEYDLNPTFIFKTMLGDQVIVIKDLKIFIFNMEEVLIDNEIKLISEIV
jgi:hypothetical protein